MSGQFFSPVGFRFSTELLPTLSDWIQRVEIPSMSIATTKVDNPFVPFNVGGDGMAYDDLTVTFKLDQDLINYDDIVTWMEAISFPSTHDTYKAWIEAKKSVLGTGVLSLLDSKFNGVARYTFEDISPNYLSGFTVQSDVDGIEYVTCSVRFSFTKATFTRTQ